MNGTVVLVTGASSGIGAAIALAFAAEGAGVAINYNGSEEGAERTLQRALKLGVPATTIKCDVGDDRQVRAMVGQVIERLGSIDILINNAGITHWIDIQDLEAMTEEKWDAIFRTNLKGAFLTSRAAMPHLMKRGSGSVVNIASVSGITGAGSSLAYSVSKAAVMALTRSLARSCAPRVRVNAIAPGVVDTPWLEGNPGLRSDFIRRARLDRVSKSEEIAQTAVFLAGSEGITGQTIIVDNGVLLA